MMVVSINAAGSAFNAAGVVWPIACKVFSSRPVSAGDFFGPFGVCAVRVFGISRLVPKSRRDKRWSSPYY